MNLNDVVITEISSVITIFSEKGRFETMTDRNSYGISFTVDGQITYTQNGTTYTQDRNHAVLLPKGQCYTIHGDKEGTFIVINFDTAEFLTDTITLFSAETVDFICRELEQIKNMLFLKDSKLAVMSILYSILNTLANNSSRKSNSLSPAIKYIENNFCQDITNADLAQECSLSEETFRKLFKAEYGTSPKQYITNMRINKAKQLLREGNLKIHEIAEQCGFSNQYHFCRYFKKKVNITPTEYLIQNRIFKI